VPQLVQALAVPMAVLRADEDQDRQPRREGRQQEWSRQPRLEAEMAMSSREMVTAMQLVKVSVAPLAPVWIRRSRDGTEWTRGSNGTADAPVARC
jgi:hypothetical protein